MVETGSTATSYEPYVGGIASPNPDYPQEIQTVTGEQMVSVSGKNLWSFNTGTFTNNSGSGTLSETHTDNTVTLTALKNTGAQFVTWYTSELDPSKIYTVSGKAKKIVKGTSGGPYIRMNYAYSDDASTWSSVSSVYNNTNPTQGTEYSFSVSVSGHKYYRFRIYNNTDAPVTVGEQTSYYELQLEEGSTATDYEPYQSQSYTIDLGSIELCKIGDYQDYIYYDKGDWYLHKEVGKQLLGDLGWYSANTLDADYKKMGTNGLSGVYVIPQTSTDILLAYCSHYFAKSEANLNRQIMGVSGRTGGAEIFIYDPDYNTSSSASNFKTWLKNNNVVLYYALATPTDTQITNENLLAQLDALKEGGSYNDKTYIKVTATDPNLPGLLYVEAAV